MRFQKSRTDTLFTDLEKREWLELLLGHKYLKDNFENDAEQTAALHGRIHIAEDALRSHLRRVEKTVNSDISLEVLQNEFGSAVEAVARFSHQGDMESCLRIAALALKRWPEDKAFWVMYGFQKVPMSSVLIRQLLDTAEDIVLYEYCSDEVRVYLRYMIGDIYRFEWENRLYEEDYDEAIRRWEEILVIAWLSDGFRLLVTAKLIRLYHEGGDQKKRDESIEKIPKNDYAMNFHRLILEETFSYADKRWDDFIGYATVILKEYSFEPDPLELEFVAREKVILTVTKSALMGDSAWCESHEINILYLANRLAKCLKEKRREHLGLGLWEDIVHSRDTPDGLQKFAEDQIEPHLGDDFNIEPNEE